MSPLQFHDALKERLKYDPIKLAKYINSDKCLIINAYFDKCVPYSCGRLLVDAHAGCEELILGTGHYTALLTLPWISYKIDNFLKKKLND